MERPQRLCTVDGHGAEITTTADPYEIKTLKIDFPRGTEATRAATRPFSTIGNADDIHRLQNRGRRMSRTPCFMFIVDQEQMRKMNSSIPYRPVEDHYARYHARQVSAGRLAAWKILLAFVVSTIACVTVRADGNSPFFVIHVVDQDTGRGVPLVQLCTTSSVCYWTDSNGVAAIEEPDFNGKEVFFTVASDGYEFQQKVFDSPGTTLLVDPGKEVTLKIKRLNLAERLYRVTGEGIYRDSVLAGVPVPPGGNRLRGLATGMDSVMFTVYHGQIFWLFGDTGRLSAPLGNFSSTCARTSLQNGNLRPEQTLDLDFYTSPNGFVKPMVDIPGPGAKWMGALMVLHDNAGHETMYARYDRVNGLVSVYDSGIAVFDDATSTFKAVKSTGPSPKYFAGGRATEVLNDGQRYFYFSNLDTVTPSVRVRAAASDILDPAKYEEFSCDLTGCGWKTGAVPVAPLFFDVDTGAPIEGKVLSLAWNKFRRRWIAILSVSLGEVWYAEADTPEGPWSYARKIITHTHSTFYWPGQIAPLDSQGGRRIYIMGTYTQTFNKNPEKTPRYEYNQLLYGLSLDTPGLAMPTARYQVRGEQGEFTAEQLSAMHLWPKVDHVVDFVDAKGHILPNRNNPFMFDRDARPVN